MRTSPGVARWTRVILVAAVVGYAALLRLDGISHQYDPVSAPGWLHRLQVARNGPSVLRPAGLAWPPAPRFVHRDAPPSQYRSDPYTYIGYAREMRSFYAAHRREPIFPFATKLWLWLLHDQDKAVSFASASFAVAAILLTVLVGAEAFSFAVGLAAAALWAIESNAILWSTEGWRDDAFAAALLLTTWLALRYHRQPTAWRGAAMGAAGGLACLVRITSVSFLVPLFGLLLIAAGRAWRVRLRSVGIAVAAMLVVAGPFAFNCWRVYGDPFYSIDTHASAYRTQEGKDEAEPASVRSYVAEHWRSRPIEALDTIALGMTTYPFTNKWAGFDPWWRYLGPCLSVASLAGLVLFTVLPAGRWLLLIVVTALLPFSFTWRLAGDWRFTQPAYPFLLLAACVVPWAAVRAISSDRALLGGLSLRAAIALAGSVLLAAGGLYYVLTRVTPPLLFKEALRAGESATLMAGDRDEAFLGAEWPSLVRGGAVATRTTGARKASILLPLPAPADYDVLLRIDPSSEPVRPGAPVPRIDVLFNGTSLDVCDPQSRPDRIGMCRLRLPAALVRAANNRLTVSTAQPVGFRWSYVRVTPAAPAASAAAR